MPDKMESPRMSILFPEVLAVDLVFEAVDFVVWVVDFVVRAFDFSIASLTVLFVWYSILN